MKNSFVLIFLLLTSINLNRAVPDKNDYIKIMHAGASNSKYITPLIISKYRLDIRLSKDEEEFLAQMQKTSQITKEDYIKMLYTLIVTDDETYSSMLDFIQNNQDYYTNSININFPDSEHIDIVVNGKTYPLYYKRTYEFLNKLAEYLRLKNCDKIVINKISNYR